MSLFKYCLSALGALMFASHVHASPAPLQLTVYNPGNDALFPVSSVIVSGQRDAILVDAQFGASQAEQVVGQIRASGKYLTTIYISHGDPDYYFGLQTLTTAFPDARIVASAPTVDHIRKTMADKLTYWGPKMGADKPSKLVIPDVLPGNSLTLEGQKLEIIGLDSPQPDRSFVWIPSIKAVVGGVVVAENIHVWMADTQGAEAQQQWIQTLQRILDLAPQTVIPGHYLGEGSRSVKAVQFTRDYVSTFLRETPKAKNSSELIGTMQRAFPNLGDESSLELSARVAKGEMQW